MRNRLALLSLCLISTLAVAGDVYNQGYTRKDGTYVQPHYQTAPDRNPYNNYSTQGNTNPYTGREGTRDPYQVQQQYSNPYEQNKQDQDRSRSQNNRW